MSLYRYILLNKPYGFLSQFTSEGGHPGLKEAFDLPAGVYPVGRLDHDSEGLLLLTDDKKLNHELLSPAKGHWRSYLVQVDFDISEDALEKLRKGVEISINGNKYLTKPAKAERIEPPAWIWERVPRVRFRQNIPTSWIRLSLTEGKNRQVRRMTAAVGHPTLRLIRYSIEGLSIEGIPHGSILEISRDEAYKKLNL